MKIFSGSDYSHLEVRSLSRICDVDDPIGLFFFDALPQRSHVGRVVRVPAVGLDHR
jgi:hypothetical protein